MNGPFYRFRKAFNVGGKEKGKRTNYQFRNVRMGYMLGQEGSK
jgi:hypothetical protein